RSRSAEEAARRRAHAHATGRGPHVEQRGQRHPAELWIRSQQLRAQARRLRAVPRGGAAHRALLARAESAADPARGCRVSQSLRVLIVEDNEDDATLLERELRRAGYAVEMQRVEDATAMADALATREWDIVLSDYSLPGF